ncbi:D-beta-hydroxybutyrate dehydrogenase-like [Ptychodera flava]|uniref:D-beta-hydroxybutyrate dehydrogenase-like n=1 Tax=Ptychodera flava TaxID=63121 RepID=UPI00396A9F1F
MNFARKLSWISKSSGSVRYLASNSYLEANLQGRVALITGSSDKNGIGIATAESLARRGCSLVLSGSRHPMKVESLTSQLARQYDVPVTYLPADLAQLENAKRLFDDVKKIHNDGVDILVNNAGMAYFRSIESTDRKNWQKSMCINLDAPFYLSKLVLSDMRRKCWGRIINIGSPLGLGGVTDAAAYVTVKHGLSGLTKCTALETAGSGVTCNAVCPAEVQTELNVEYRKQVFGKDQSMTLDDFKRTVQSAVPSGTFLKAEQVAELVAFLCSPAADQITGSDLLMDGGYNAM